MAQSLRARSPRTIGPRAPPVARHQPPPRCSDGAGFLFGAQEACVVPYLPATYPATSYNRYRPL